MPPPAHPVSSVAAPDLRSVTVLVAECIGDRPRNAAIDHLRVLLTCLVIFHHVAIAYGGSGGWYWREQADSSQPLLLIFNATNQSFFMGFFFLVRFGLSPGRGAFFEGSGVLSPRTRC
jgi:peptidoglycan/LPS O-acetylase OafA/YrhL